MIPVPRRPFSLVSTFTALVAMSLLVGGSSRAESTLPEVQGTSATFQIEDKVVNQAPPNFGDNIMPPIWTHWDTEPWHNQWWTFPNLEPICTRIKDVATGGGADFMLNEPASGPKVWRAGAGYFDVFRDGFFDGAKLEIFRYEDGKCVKVRDATVKEYKAAKGGENKITFTEPGPEVREGDEYLMEVVRNDTPEGTTRTRVGKVNTLRGYQFSPQTDARLKNAGVISVIDSKTAAPGGGTGSLCLTIPEGAAPADLGYWLHADEREDYPRLKEGAPYTVSLWLKQSSMPGGKVTVRAGKLGEAEFAVTGDWKEYTVDFTGAPPAGLERFEIIAEESGTLWIDNVAIYENGSTPRWGWYPQIIEQLKSFQPSNLRLWAAQVNLGYGRSLDSAIGPIFQAQTEFNDTGADSPIGVGLHDELKLCKEVGANPWIIVSTMWFTEEYANFIEYLAGPPDSAYGKKRAALGQVEPWTKVFPKLMIETGNEAWNSTFHPQGFIGRPKLYGQWSERIFQTMKASPHFPKDQVEFVLNGFIHSTKRPYGYASQAVENSPSADAADVAYYTGGWDGVGMPDSANPKENWLNILTYTHRMLRPLSLDFVKANEEIGKERGRPVHSLVYEAGPGYTLPKPTGLNMEEQREGKSLGHAINALESFMQNIADGFREQNFFLFKNGHFWSSHNRAWEPHIVWQMLGLRNTQLKGDLITAKALECPKISIPASVRNLKNQLDDTVTQRKFPALNDLELIRCYPFKEGNRYSYMLVSLQLDKSTPVTVNLPVAMKASAKIFQIADPDIAAHNIDKLAVRVQEREVKDFAQSYQLEVPSHSVTVIVAEAAQ